MTEPTIEDRTFRSRGAANPDVGLIARHATTRDASILARRGVVAGAITQIGDGHAVDEHADGTLSDLARRRCGRGSARNPRGRPVVTGAGFVVSKTRAYWPELLVSHELSSTSARALRVEGLNTAVRRNLETGNGIITA